MERIARADINGAKRQQKSRHIWVSYRVTYRFFPHSSWNGKKKVHIPEWKVCNENRMPNMTLLCCRIGMVESKEVIMDEVDRRFHSVFPFMQLLVAVATSCP
jgi:hypothetical protein